MDETLQKLYSPSQWSKRLPSDKIVDAHGEFMKKKSDLAYKSLNHYEYKFSNENVEEAMHIFCNDSNSFDCDENTNKISFSGRKVFMYIHGGYWQWGSILASSFMAENFTAKDVIVVAVGYNLAPKVTITQIVHEIERSVAKVLEFSDDKTEIYICGHSAGGHLAAILLQTDFMNKYNVDSSRIKGLIPVSGVFDLRPLLKTDINDNPKMNLNEAESISPLLKESTFLTELQKNEIKILLAYGEDESSAFKKQSMNYSLHLQNILKIKNVKCFEVKNSDHFDIIENISDDSFVLTKEIYKLMNI